MKIKDVENIQKWLDDIKVVADKESYNVSSAINKSLVKILPLLKEEHERLSDNHIEVNCPKIYIFTNRDAKEYKQTVQDYMNNKLQGLVSNDFKILDFGKMDEEFEDDNSRTIYFYIKYTS